MRYEFKNGLYENKIKIIIGFSILVFISYVVITDCLLLNGDSFQVGDGWLYLFSGSMEYKYSADGKFELPIIWFLFHAYLYYMLCGYPVNTLKKAGTKSMLFAGTRTKWVISKIVWTLTNVIMFYFVQFLCLVIGASIYNQIAQIDISFTMTTQILKNQVIMFLLPLVADIAIALMQMANSFFFSPFIAYIFTLAYLIFSVYIKSEFLLGNYSMLLRTTYLDKNGLSIGSGFIAGVILSIGFLGTLIFYMCKKDIIGEGREA